jgi:hypothetical protein
VVSIGDGYELPDEHQPSQQKVLPSVGMTKFGLGTDPNNIETSIAACASLHAFGNKSLGKKK